MPCLQTQDSRPDSCPGAQVIVEAKTRNVLRLLQAACSRRVIAVPTTQVAARRWAAQTCATSGSQHCRYASSCGPACAAYSLHDCIQPRRVLGGFSLLCFQNGCLGVGS